MADDTKKQRDKERRKLKAKSDKVYELFNEKEYDECLRMIDGIGGNAMRNLTIYECAIGCNMLSENLEGALTLIADHSIHGHAKKSCSVLFNEAVCNMLLKKYVEAYKLFENLLMHKDIDDTRRQGCDRYMKEIEQKILETEPKIEEDELVHGPSSSSTSKLELVTVVSSPEPESLKADPVAESSSSTPSTLKADPVAESPSSTPSTSNADPVAATSKADPVAESSASTSSTSKADPVVESPLASSSQKTTKFESFEFSENVLFEMDGVDEQSYDCSMLIGGQTFQKTLIVEKEGGDESTFEDAPFKMRGGSFLLKHQFTVPSYSSRLQRKLYVVERALPIPVFFKKKLIEFNGNGEEEWWEFISEYFRKIFRGILGGMFAVHAANRTCGGDLDSSMYVTIDSDSDVQGRIFYVRGAHYSEAGAQKDLDDLLSTMEAVITLINPRGYSVDKSVWRKELIERYKLPFGLYHFLERLRDNKVAGNMILTTWLIDHPYFWPIEHKLDFIRILNDVLRQGLIKEKEFTNLLPYLGGVKGWNSIVSSNGLLNAIYTHNRSSNYDNGADACIINFLLAVLNYANDRMHAWVRGNNNQLTPADILLLIQSVCPNIYFSLYDIMCSYANAMNPMSREEREGFLQALERCSSFRQ